tara:strand:+ start:524 stop:637 length:114 start_codon:yes stop_codon:yes gene_type:complete
MLEEPLRKLVEEELVGELVKEEVEPPERRQRGNQMYQ